MEVRVVERVGIARYGVDAMVFGIGRNGLGLMVSKGYTIIGNIYK